MTSGKKTEPRWVRLGLSRQSGVVRINDLSSQLKYEGRWVDVVGPSTPESPALPSAYGRQEDLLLYFEMLQLQHLEYSHPFGDVTRYAHALASVGADYFLGAWRDDTFSDDGERIDRARSRKEFPWFDELRFALAGALLAGRGEEIRQIASYVGDDLPFDEGAWDRTADDNRFYKVLSHFFLTGELESVAESLGALERSRKKRPRIMAQCLRAIAGGGGEAVARALTDCTMQYRKVELDPPYGRIVVSVDGTILWNLAIGGGVVLPQLSTDVMDVILTPGSIGTAPE